MLNLFHMNTFRVKFQYIWQNAEHLLIVLFLATFAFNIRKVFLTPYSYLNGEFNEYLTLNFSWADLLMLATILIYTIKRLYSQLNSISADNSLLCIVIRFKSTVLRCLKNVSRETFILFLFLAWSGISIIWSEFKLIAVYRAITLGEITIFPYIAYRILSDNKKWLNIGLLALIANGLFQSVLGIFQFVVNKSLGLKILSEGILGPNLPGVAKIIIAGEKHIRAYGTFPHPNILAGFLIIPIFLVLAVLLKGFKTARKSSENVSHETLTDIISVRLALVFFPILLIGLLLTFSRSAFLGSGIGLLFFLFSRRKISFNKLRPLLASIIILVVLGLGCLIYQSKSLISVFSTQSLEERTFYQNVARETISSYPAAGVGIGQFVFSEFLKRPNLPGWQYQPVHNIYLLIFSELGIIGLIFFLLWIFSILGWGSEKERNTSLLLTFYLFYCIIISYLIILLFDHYFWDIKIGMIIFTLPIVFLKTLSGEKI